MDCSSWSYRDHINSSCLGHSTTCPFRFFHHFIVKDGMLNFKMPKHIRSVFTFAQHILVACLAARLVFSTSNRSVFAISFYPEVSPNHTLCILLLNQIDTSQRHFTLSSYCTIAHVRDIMRMHSIVCQ